MNVPDEVVSRRAPSRGAVLALLVVALFIVPFALVRLVDGDEGYLLLAARLVREGKVPYRDFFFPQTPVLPYTYALLTSPFGLSWTSARVLTGAMVVLIGGLLYAVMVKQGASLARGVSAAAVFATTPLVFAWLVVAKTLGISTLFLYLAYALSVGLLSHRPRLRGWLIGVALVLAVGSRFYVGVLFPVLVIAWSKGRTKPSLVSMAVGVACALLPLGIVLGLSPKSAYFGIVGYHLTRSDLHGWASLAQKLDVLKQAFGLGQAEQWLGLQHLLLTIGAAAGVLWRWRSTRTIRPAALAFAALFAASLVPTPSFVQYFALSAPFLVELALLDGVDAVRSATTRWAPLVLSVAAVANTIFCGLEADRHGRRGTRVLGIMEPENARAWSIPAVRAVGRAVVARAGDQFALSPWPGYFVEGSVRVFPGTEDHFARWAGDKLSDPADRARFRVAGPVEIADALRGHRATVIVQGNSIDWTLTREELVENGYEPVETVRGSHATIWLARP